MNTLAKILKVTVGSIITIAVVAGLLGGLAVFGIVILLAV